MPKNLPKMLQPGMRNALRRRSTRLLALSLLVFSTQQVNLLTLFGKTDI
jgi:hypothetical protein